MNDPNEVISDKVKDEDEAGIEETFNFRVENFPSMSGSVLSEPCMIRKLPWRILIKKTETQRGTQLGYFLQYNGESKSTSWSCFATAELRMINQKDGKMFSRKTNHLYNKAEDDWGFGFYKDLKIVLDPKNGFIKNDCVIFQVKVIVDAPQGLIQQLDVDLPVHVGQHPDVEVPVPADKYPDVDVHVLGDQHFVMDIPVLSDQHPDGDLPVLLDDHTDVVVPVYVSREDFLAHAMAHHAVVQGQFPTENYQKIDLTNTPVYDCVLTPVPNQDQGPVECPVWKLKVMGDISIHMDMCLNTQVLNQMNEGEGGVPCV